MTTDLIRQNLVTPSVTSIIATEHRYDSDRIEAKTSVDVELEDEGVVIRGRIDVLVLKKRLWMLVIESKRSDYGLFEFFVPCFVRHKKLTCDPAGRTASRKPFT